MSDETTTTNDNTKASDDADALTEQQIAEHLAWRAEYRERLTEAQRAHFDRDEKGFMHAEIARMEGEIAINREATAKAEGEGREHRRRSAIAASIAETIDPARADLMRIALEHRKAIAFDAKGAPLVAVTIELERGRPQLAWLPLAAGLRHLCAHDPAFRGFEREPRRRPVRH
jgi:hypothetical protein